MVRMSSYDAVFSSPMHPSDHLTTSRLTSPTCEDLGIPINITTASPTGAGYRRDSPSLSPVMHDIPHGQHHAHHAATAAVLMRQPGAASHGQQPPPPPPLPPHGPHPHDVFVGPSTLFSAMHAGIKYAGITGSAADAGNVTDPFCMYNQIPLPAPYGAFDCANEPAFIRKRNERERERVRCVNEGYARLRQHLPLDKRDKRISKVETLRAAISYIHHLQKLLSDLDDSTEQEASKRACDDEEKKDGKKRPCSNSNDNGAPVKKKRAEEHTEKTSADDPDKHTKRLDENKNSHGHVNFRRCSPSKR